MTIKEKIFEYISSEEYKPMYREGLVQKFQISKGDEKMFFDVLKQLEKEGLILRDKNDKYIPLSGEYMVVGSLIGNEKGFGFVESENREDIYISPENMNGAIHKDTVIVNLLKDLEPGKKAEGEIIKILKRANTQIIGTFEGNNGFGFVVPDEKRITYDVYIQGDRMSGAKDGQKVVVEVTKWPSGKKNIEGKVVEVLGFMTDKGVDVLSVIKERGLRVEFPAGVSNQVEKIPQEVSEEDMENREDIRDMVLFTIDGPDAKDIDDAVSIEVNYDGNYLLGVHIADVSHYVKEKTPLDREALIRGNSVYLLDRVLPMLPKELSNGICSLNEGVDRLAMSVFMEITPQGKIKAHRISETVINSKKRLEYGMVSDFLEDDDEDAKRELGELTAPLKHMHDLMEILSSKRHEKGALDFNFPESQIILDKDGFVTGIEREERRVSERLIEEFMIVTNETVGEEYFWAELPFLYRIHEEPSEERLNQFLKFVHGFGYTVKGMQNDIHPRALQQLMEEIKGKKGEYVLNTLLLRSLKKARYSDTNDVHFGLASKYYSHFTAPIRRYSDLQIHRIIKENLNGKLDYDRIMHYEAILPEVAEQVSLTERAAEEAEREVEDIKKTEYMSQFIGEEFDAIISSMTNFGIFVQLENTVEGLIHFNTLVDDYYVFDENTYTVTGERTKKRYNLGDSVRVVLVRAEVNQREIDFQFV
ncbi:MAG: ribonuclease R [Tissierellia bacterium]|nr:ribonuclease R [Tissierellia bacterium]